MEQTVKNLLGLPELASVHGRDVDQLIIYVHYLMVVLFVGWTAYFFYCLYRFRKGRNPKADHHGVTGHASNYLEVAIAIVEVILLLGFAVPLWAKVVDAFPTEKDNPVNVRVIAQQFNWTARYPGKNGKFGKQDIGLVTPANPYGLHQLDPELKKLDLDGADDVLGGSLEMAIPVNRPVIAGISSMDVIHSFKVLAMRVTQDAIPGMRIPIHFQATATNTYQINCAQLCGNGHAGMKGVLKVLTQEEFDAWIKDKEAKAAAGPVEF
ncbi:MAG: cytochrome c oxidase subunit [Verrucomicrobiota bacterium]|jgi:cytochrome c oxidase subunit 2